MPPSLDLQGDKASLTQHVPSPWLSASEATRYLRLPSVRALYQAVRRGWVPAHRFGPRQLRFHRWELDKLLGAPTSDGQR
jgi:excisionase family DNA binding protein